MVMDVGNYVIKLTLIWYVVLAYITGFHFDDFILIIVLRIIHLVCQIVGV